MHIRAIFSASAVRRCLVALVIATSVAYGADSDPDPAFGDGGFALHRSPDDTIQAQTTAGAVAGDGSVIVAGSISYPSGQQQYAITLVRYRSDGTPDASFGTNGAAQLDLDPAPHINETIYAVFPRADRSLLVLAGVQIPGRMAVQPLLVSVRSDGTPDSTFGPGGKRLIDISAWTDSDIAMQTAVMQPDGKIVMAGKHVYENSYNIALGRVLPDGRLDTSFSGDGWRQLGGFGAYDWSPEAITLDDTGRILVVGRADGSEERPVVFRVSADGEPDIGFGPLGDGARVLEGLDGSWTARAVVAAHRVVSSGFGVRRLFVAISANSPQRTAIAALSDDGAPVATFGDNGFVDLSREQGSRITALALGDEEKIVAAGFIDPITSGTGTDILVARVTFGGDLDSTFDGNGVARYPIDPSVTTNDSVATLLLSAQRPVIVGMAYDSTTPSWYSVAMRLQSDAIFADGFNW